MHRQVQADIGNLYDLHRTLKTALEKSGYSESFLFRVDMEISSRPVSLLLQTNRITDSLFNEMPENYCLEVMKSKDLAGLSGLLQAGKTFRFFLRANPIRKIRNSDGKHPAKVPLVHANRKINEKFESEGFVDWINRQAINNGFEVTKLIFFRTSTYQWRKGARSRQVPLFSVDYEGYLRVSDPFKLYNAITKGIGPSKAFGMGLLSLAPAY